uniref:Uncharacterized protein n=2 Tax=Caenorhabditis japonica TaxID=281687 RepID=A0A8R1EM20_CAEJA
MMTGYGYNANLVQQPPVLQGVNEEWGQTGEQAQFYQVSGTTELSNPPFYGSSGWYQAPCCNFAEGAAASSQPSGLAPPTSNPFHLMHPTLAPPPPPQPRVSISDEELYQALNMSPLPHTSSGYMHLQNHPQTTDLSYLSSEVCFPSTSSSGYHDQVGFMPSTSAGLPEDPRHVLGNDGDDEESFEEPERFETMSPTFSIHSFAPTTSTNTAEAEDLEVELINNSKAPPKYQLIEDIDLFMRATTEETEYSDDDDSRVRKRGVRRLATPVVRRG